MKNTIRQILVSIAIFALFVSFGARNDIFADPPPGGGNNGAIWTTDDSCGDEQQDVNQYDQGDWVYINGNNFDSGTYDWTGHQVTQV